MTKTEKEYFENRYNDLSAKIETHNEKLDKNDELTKKLEIVVTGNGGEGHEQRLKRLETWRDDHPKTCPLERKTKEILARRAVDAAIIGVVITILLWVLDKLPW